jgi:hypothetical protein
MLLADQSGPSDLAKSALMSTYLTEAEWIESLRAAQQELETARALLEQARTELEAFETRARDAWRRRNAASDSRVLTIRSARACGLFGTSSMAAAIRRCDNRIAAATIEIREIIESSRQTCALFEWVWEVYRKARAAEISVLQQRPPITVAEPERRSITEERLAAVRTALEESLATQASEEKLRRVELALPDDEHYDPQYDDAELLKRRMRPWL